MHGLRSKESWVSLPSLPWLAILSWVSHYLSHILGFQENYMSWREYFSRCGFLEVQNLGNGRSGISGLLLLSHNIAV